MNSVPRWPPAGGWSCRARGLGQETGELEPLRLAARQGGHRLAELDVFQPHIHDRLQRADHLAVVGKQHMRPR
jgi:hypothetical protein